MKRFLGLIVAMLLISSSAFASKARMIGLGQNGETGSYYIADTVGVFSNPATLNDMKNYIITEWGAADQGFDSGNTTPNAEGGYFQEFGNFAYGIYLGSEARIDDANKALIEATVLDADDKFESHKNGVDLFFAGDAGIKWGARFHYAGNKSERNYDSANAMYETKHGAMGLGLGVIWKKLSVYTNLGLNDKSEGQTDDGNDLALTVKKSKWEANLDLNIGASYDIFGLTIFAEYNKSGFEYTSGVVTEAKAEYAKTEMILGVGRINDVAKNARIVTSLHLNMKSDEGKDVGNVMDVTAVSVAGSAWGQEDKVEGKTTQLTLAAGFEVDAASWLTWRGGVTQTIILNSRSAKVSPAETPNLNDKKDSTAATTTIASGATLNFGNLKVDGLIGTSAGHNGLLRTDQLLTRVGVHYWF